MKRDLKTSLRATAFTSMLALLFGCGILAAQSSQQGSQQQPPAQQSDKDKKPDAAPLTLDSATPASAAPTPASPEEEAGYKVFNDTPMTDPKKKSEAGETFLQKYPQSRYRPAVYQILVSSYFQLGQVQKLEETADKDLALNPNDVPVLAVLSQTLARTYKANTPTPEGAAQQLAKAEECSKRAIEVTPTLPKPANVADDVFNNAKSDTLEMAHGSLGLVYLQRGKFAEAIPELEESIKDDRHPDPDPVNFYLLGIANDRTSHFEAAATAYTKCAAQQSTLQAVCKNNAEQSKKKSTTELSAPK